MKRKTIIRCGSEAITVGICEIVGAAIKFVEVIHLKLVRKTDSVDGWLNALNLALDKIPLSVRSSTDVVIPPNDELFIKLIHTIDPNLKSYAQTLQFEFNHAFKGGNHEWAYDAFRPSEDSEDAFCFAMHRSFVEKFLDCLLRNHVNFSYLCPEHLLNNFALRSLNKHNILSLHIGSNISSVAFVGKNFTHVKNLNVGGNWINNKLMEAANLTNDEAEQKKLALTTNDKVKDLKDVSFIEYYLNQFAQKIHGEVKNAEMYYCGRFGETPIKSVLLSGNGGKFPQIEEVFNQSSKIKIIKDKDLFGDCLDNDLSIKEQTEIEPYLAAFYGAGLCIVNPSNAVNLFSEDLQDQLIFQKNNPKYMVLATCVTLFLIFLSGFMQKNLRSLHTEKEGLIEKTAAAECNCKNYDNLSKSYNEINIAINKSKFVYNNQAEWLNLFGELQNVLAEAKNAWIEKFDWVDFASRSTSGNLSTTTRPISRNVIQLTIKQFFNSKELNDEGKKMIVDGWLDNLKKRAFVDDIENIQLHYENADLLRISFELILKNNIGVLANE